MIRYLFGLRLSPLNLSDYNGRFWLFVGHLFTRQKNQAFSTKNVILAKKRNKVLILSTKFINKVYECATFFKPTS